LIEISSWSTDHEDAGSAYLVRVKAVLALPDGSSEIMFSEEFKVSFGFEQTCQGLESLDMEYEKNVIAQVGNSSDFQLNKAYDLL